MKKTFILLFLFFVTSCAFNRQPDYDTSVFFVSPDVKIKQLTAYSSTQAKSNFPQVVIEGISTKNQTVHYKVEWFTAEGMPIKSIMSGWNKKTVTANMPINWSAISSSPKAAKYRISITENIGSGILK